MTAPVQKPKVNLHCLLRQVQTQKEQEYFFIKNGLLPKNIECPKCKDNLTQVYPLTNPAAKFKYFKCSCSPREKIPVTKDTMMYQSKLSLPVYLVLLYGFCYRGILVSSATEHVLFIKCQKILINIFCNTCLQWGLHYNIF